ncbi:MAG TPA: hypothetical protein VJJ78_03400 [Candidatus Saccharimonadales bacterium]|nr:hypothetical protein [Candidatus Saccharimonadales bacterium]
MSAVSSLEKSLGDLFKSAPKLPANGKKALVQYLPWINAILGALMLFAAYSLWHWADKVNNAVDYVNELTRAFGGQEVVGDRFSVGIWIGVVLLVVEAVLYLAAFIPTKARQKKGWNLLFYAMLVNIVYAVVVLFTDYGGAGNLIGYLIGAVIGFYLLFQIRDSYS